MNALTTAALVVVAAISISHAAPSNPDVSLHTAALQGDVAATRQHIESGADLNAKDAYGSTPLIIAATFGHTAVATMLIDAGADVQIPNSEGSTPLHVAAFLCRTEIVKALLDHGADRRARNKYANTAFDSMVSPFDEVRGIYDKYAEALGPLGLQLDYARIEATRPKIAAMLQEHAAPAGSGGYAPRPAGTWAVSTPKEQGLDPKLVATLYGDAASLTNLYSLLLVKNGRLVAEQYFNGSSAEQTENMQSVTKSYTSALVGIALEHGKLPSVERTMLEYFPETADQVKDPRKKQITIRQMLQMRGGFPWEETAPELWNALLSGRFISRIPEIPLVADPGSQFNYSNLTSNWLGIILARACGSDLRSYAEEHLFKPLGVVAGDWGRDGDGYNTGCGDLHMTARGMARFGLLYLRGGKLDGKQVVPARWVQESLANYSPDAWITRDKSRSAGPYFRDLGYGYQWWSATVGAHEVDFAWGHGGQLIVLLHELDLIVVTTADPFYLEHNERSWEHEKAVLNLVGRFIRLLPEAG